MDPHILAGHISYSIVCHSDNAKREDKKTRIWDKQTPYGVHPVWCAMTLMQETSLPDEFRNLGAQALLFHDLLEDTTEDLPPGIDPRVRELVEGLTFAGFSEEMEKIWKRNPEIRLLKLYDKVSNLLDGIWMQPNLWNRYVIYTHGLADDVELNY